MNSSAPYFARIKPYVSHNVYTIDFYMRGKGTWDIVHEDEIVMVLNQIQRIPGLGDLVIVLTSHAGLGVMYEEGLEECTG